MRNRFFVLVIALAGATFAQAQSPLVAYWDSSAYPDDALETSPASWISFSLDGPGQFRSEASGVMWISVKALEGQLQVGHLEVTTTPATYGITKQVSNGLEERTFEIALTVAIEAFFGTSETLALGPAGDGYLRVEGIGTGGLLGFGNGFLSGHYSIKGNPDVEGMFLVDYPIERLSIPATSNRFLLASTRSLPRGLRLVRGYYGDDLSPQEAVVALDSTVAVQLFSEVIDGFQVTVHARAGVFAPANLYLGAPWAHWMVNEYGWVDTGDFLGPIFPLGDWAWVGCVGAWAYLPEEFVGNRGAWLYVVR